MFSSLLKPKSPPHWSWLSRME